MSEKIKSQVRDMRRIVADHFNLKEFPAFEGQSAYRPHNTQEESTEGEGT